MTKILCRFVPFGLALLLVGCGGGPKQSALLGDLNVMPPQKIAFASDRGGQGLMEPYYMNWDGSQQTKVPLPADFVGLSWDPAISPDGSKIVFSYVGPDFADLYLVDLNNGNLAPLTSGADSFAPNFSPDGTKIIFIRLTQDYVPHIWLMNSDGSGQIDITVNSISGYDSANLSPDGTQIIAVRDTEETPSSTKLSRMGPRPSLAIPEAGHDIVSLGLDGSGETVIATEAGEGSGAQLTPDAHSLVFTAQVTQNAVFSELVADHTRTILTPTDSNNYGSMIVGNYIYFVSTRDGNSAVYRMDLDGTNEVRLTDPSQNNSLGVAIH